MKYLNLVVIATLFMSASTFAAKGSEGGNGGSGVMCLDSRGAIKSATVLDLFEGKTLRGIIPQMGPLTVPYEKKVADVIDRLDRRDHELAEYLRADWSQFLKNTQFIQGADLVPIHDTLSLIAPRGCQTVQIAIHREKMIKTDKEYLINDELWNAMDNDNKAALVLHEMIYARAVAHGAQDSRATRYLVSLITSTLFNEMPIADYIETMRAIGITLDVNVQGYLLSLTRSQNAHMSLSQDVQVNSDGTITGYYTGGKKSIVVSGKKLDLLEPKAADMFSGSYLNFYADGSVSSVSSVAPGQDLVVALEGTDYRIDLRGGLSLNRNGSVKAAVFKDPYPFSNGGTLIKTPKDFLLWLSESGRLIGFRKWSVATGDNRLRLKTNGKPEYIHFGQEVICKDFTSSIESFALTSDGLVDLGNYTAEIRGQTDTLLNWIEKGTCKFAQ